MRFVRILLAVAALLCGLGSEGRAWHDETHLAISKAAGYRKWYNSAGADIAKEKAFKVEQYNHYFDAEPGDVLDARLVMSQVRLYNDPTDSKGHLYGAIIASLREYSAAVNANKYEQYPLAYCAHYIGDLSQPLHNHVYNDFNKERHMANDATVEDEVLAHIGKIKRYMYRIDLDPDNFETSLAQEIARIARISNAKARLLEAEHRNLTREEAYRQLGHSASLLQAVLRVIPKLPRR